MTVGKLVDPVDIAEAMEKLYTNKELYNNLSTQSIEKFTSERFSWKEIAKKWEEIFVEVLQ